jgi:putative component of toxin-antitoxin plasmid stabilization module
MTDLNRKKGVGQEIVELQRIADGCCYNVFALQRRWLNAVLFCCNHLSAPRRDSQSNRGRIASHEQQERECPLWVAGSIGRRNTF